MRKRTLNDALPIVAKAYGDKLGVRVQIGNDQAYTDGETITVPNIPDTAKVAREALWGYLAHEAAHVRFTDFSVERRRGLHAELSNVLEDARIEQEMPRVYPGTRKTMNSMAEYMAEAGHYAHVSDDTHPANIILAYSLYWLQSKAVGQSVLEPYLESATRALQDVFPSGVFTRLNVLLRKAAVAQSTEEAVSLTDQILKMLEEEKEKEQSGDDQDQTPDSSDSSDSSSDDTSSGDSADGDAEDDDSDGDDGGNSSGDGDDADDDPTSQQGGAADGSSSESDSGQGRGASDKDRSSTEPEQLTGSSDGGTKANAIEQALGADESDLSDSAHQSFVRELQDLAQEQGDDQYVTVRDSVPAISTELGSEMAAKVKSTSAKIRSQLYGLVQAKQRSAHATKRRGKRLDKGKLYRLSSGDTRVFRQRDEQNRPNTAIHLVVDISGSMGNLVGGANKATATRAVVAQEAALALSLALEAIPGVNPAVTYFGGYKSMWSVVRHGESVKANQSRFRQAHTGSTPMAEAVWNAGYQLVQTKEPRKLMIVVTDGEPDVPAATVKALELCENTGIELAGIGIGAASVSSFFDQHIVISDVVDLRSQLFKLVERSLTANAA